MEKTKIVKLIAILLCVVIVYAFAGKLSSLDVSELVEAGNKAWSAIETEDEKQSSGVEEKVEEKIEAVKSAAVQSGGNEND